MWIMIVIVMVIEVRHAPDILRIVKSTISESDGNAAFEHSCNDKSH